MDRSSLEKELKLAISRELKRLRRQDDCSLERMAEKVGLEYSSLYNIYSGRNLPQLTTLIQISQTYNIPIDFWFKNIKQLVVRKKENHPAAPRNGLFCGSSTK
jgi:transcriptional regulator with XRE-family HTH domain